MESVAVVIFALMISSVLLWFLSSQRSEWLLPMKRWNRFCYGKTQESVESLRNSTKKHRKAWKVLETLRKKTQESVESLRNSTKKTQESVESFRNSTKKTQESVGSLSNAINFFYNKFSRKKKTRLASATNGRRRPIHDQATSL